VTLRSIPEVIRSAIFVFGFSLLLVYDVISSIANGSVPVQLKIKIDLAPENSATVSAQAPFDPIKIRNFLLMLVMLSSLVCSMAYSMWPSGQAYAETLDSNTAENVGILPIIMEDDEPPKQPDIVLGDTHLLVEKVTALDSETTVKVLDVNTAQNAELEPSNEAASIIENEHVARAQLTSAIVRREPIDNITLLSLANNKQIFYFTQINQLKDKVISHRWRLNGKVMAQVSLSIGGDKWRTYSSKTFNNSMLGRWEVAVLDENENVLSVTEFDVTQ